MRKQGLLFMSRRRQIGFFAAAPIGAWFIVLCSSASAGAVERGHVAYATQQCLYLDVGTADGLRVGDTLILERGKSLSAVSCHVLAVFEHGARCSAAAHVRHASFVLPRPRPRPAVAGVAPLPPGLPSGSRERYLATLQNLPARQVAYRRTGQHALKSRRRAAWAALSHDNWVTLGGTRRNLQREQLDVGLVGAQLFAQSRWEGSLRLTALAWSAQDDLMRFRPNSRAQLYVWQAQIDNLRGLEGPLVAGGRILPSYVPGVAVLDGAQVGWDLRGNTAELGGYAGFIPSPMTLAPSDRRWTVGAYNRASRSFGLLGYVQNSARLAFVSLPGAQSRFELESLTHLRLGGWVQAGFNPRFGLPIDSGKLLLEAVRFNLTSSWRKRVHLYAGVRYATGEVDIVDGIADYVAILRKTVASQVALTVLPYPWISIAAQNAVAWDKATGTLHVLTGPELGLPRLFGNSGRLSLAYLQEAGSKKARSAFVQGQLRLSQSMSLTLRSSYFEDLFQTDRLLREMSFYAGYRLYIQQWLTLDLSALARHGLHNSRMPGDAPYSVRTSIRLLGRF